MAKTNSTPARLTAAQRRAAEIADRIDGAATCISGIIESLDSATNYGLTGNTRAMERIKWATGCAHDALTLLHPRRPI